MRLPSALAESYSIKNHLPTKGAEADIFLVQHIANGKDSIAKIYRKGIECKLELLERLHKLDSRHVVQIINYGKSDGHWFELMEFLPFGTLDILLRRDALHSEKMRRAVLTELHEALEYLHRNGIFHRDLKPENILVREEEPLQLVFSDFGIASLSESSIRFTQGAGTLHYSAPEQIVAAATVTGKTDYWSLGMIMFEMLIGRHPFSKLGEHAIASALVTSSTGTESTLPFDMIVDLKWQTLCRGLLIRDPQQRWGADEVRRWLQGEESLTIRTKKKNVTYRPYIFNGQEYFTPEELAEALASDWTTAIKHLQRGYITIWLSKEVMNQHLAVLSEDLLENQGLSSDKRLHLLLIDMNPYTSPKWKDLILNIDTIEKLAVEYLNGNENSIHIINDLIEEDVLISNEKYNTLIDKEKFEKISIILNDKKNCFNKAWRSIVNFGIPEHVRPNNDVITSSLLLSSISRYFNDEIKQKYFNIIKEKNISTQFVDEQFGHDTDDFCKHLLVLNFIEYFEKNIIADIKNKIVSIQKKVENYYKWVVNNNSFLKENYNYLLYIKNNINLSNREELLNNIINFESELTLNIKAEYIESLRDLKNECGFLSKKIKLFQKKIDLYIESIQNDNFIYDKRFHDKMNKIEEESSYFSGFIRDAEIFLASIPIKDRILYDKDYKQIIDLITGAIKTFDYSKIEKAKIRCGFFKKNMSLWKY